MVFKQAFTHTPELDDYRLTFDLNNAPHEMFVPARNEQDAREKLLYHESSAKNIQVEMI